MRVHFFRDDLEKKTFWVSLSKEETLKYIGKYINNVFWNYLGFDHQQNLESLFDSDRDNLSCNNEHYFSITSDLSNIRPSIRIFPISNMWNGGNPWKRITLDISSLEELSSIDISNTISCYEDPLFEDDYSLHLCGRTHEEVEKKWNENFPGIPFVRESSRRIDEIFK